MKSNRDVGTALVAIAMIILVALSLASLGEIPSQRSSSAPSITATPLPTVNPTPFGGPIAVGTPLPTATPAAIPIQPSNAGQLTETMLLGEPIPASLTTGVFSRDGQWFVADWNEVTVWQMPQGVVARTLPLLRTHWGPMALSPDGEYVVVGNYPELGWVELWHIPTAEMIRQHRGGRQVRALGFNASGTLLAAGREDGSVTVWEVETGDLLHELAKYEYTVCMGMAFHPERDEIAASSSGNTVRIWDAWSGLVLDELSMPEPPLGCELSSLAYTPDGQMLAGAMFWEHAIVLWEGNEFVAKLAHPDGGITWQIAWSPDGRLIATTGYTYAEGAQIVLWDVQQREIATALSPWRDVAAFSPDGAMLVAHKSIDLTGTLWTLRVPTHSTYLPLALRTVP